VADEAVEEPKSFKEMCDVIVTADFLRKKDGRALTSEEIFNYSSTGELFMIFEWYEIAFKINAAKIELARIFKLAVEDPQESIRQAAEAMKNGAFTRE